MAQKAAAPCCDSNPVRGAVVVEAEPAAPEKKLLMEQKNPPRPNRMGA